MSEQITLTLESDSIKYLIQKDARLAKVIKTIGPISYSPHTDNPYAFLVHEIIEQMLSQKAGQSIYSRFENLCGLSVEPETVKRLTVEEMKSVGMSANKALYIKALTDAVNDGSLNFNEFPGLSDREIISKLTTVKGIGTWSSKMYLIFVLNRQDILPFEDGAFLQSYKWLYKTDDCSKESMEKKCRKWKPYSSIASRYLYRALDMGLTRTEFHLYKED